MSDEFSGAIVGVPIALIIAVLINLAIQDAGRKACMSATGAEDCVKEWRPNDD
ncbi:MAG: hypothetical protein H5U19_14315 [Rhodobacteraceae bacterium]|nr:hypothetical protein [Paracoccaceae bacterium]